MTFPRLSPQKKYYFIRNYFNNKIKGLIQVLSIFLTVTRENYSKLNLNFTEDFLLLESDGIDSVVRR